MVGRVDVRGDEELKRTVAAIRAVDKNIRSDIRRQTRSAAVTIWRDALGDQRASSLQRALIVNTSLVAASDNGIKVTAASQKRKATRGGAVPVEDAKAYEFGTNTEKVSRYRTRGQGTVNRHTNRAMPKRKASGYVFYPAVADAAPRILALWSQTVVRVVGEALDGEQS